MYKINLERGVKMYENIINVLCTKKIYLKFLFHIFIFFTVVTNNELFYSCFRVTVINNRLHMSLFVEYLL